MGCRALQVAYAALVLTGACQAFLLPPVFFGGALRQVVVCAHVCAHEMLACEARARLAREPQEADAGRATRARERHGNLHQTLLIHTDTDVRVRALERARSCRARAPDERAHAHLERHQTAPR